MDALLNFDYRVFEILNNFAGHSKAWDSVFVFFSEYIMFALIVGLAVFWVLEKSPQRARTNTVLQALIAAFIGRALIVSLIRMVFFRSRPFVLSQVVQLVPHNGLEGSFPSGHTTVMFSLAFVLLQKNRRWGTAYLVFALLSGLSRVVVGVHYPLDILGGVVVAGVSAMAAQWIFEKVQNPNDKSNP